MNRTTIGTGGTVFVFTVHIGYAPPPPPPPRVLVDSFHPCAVLGIPCKAPLDQVKAAYRRLAKATHPDLGPEDEREERTKQMAELNRAFAMLTGASR